MVPVFSGFLFFNKDEALWQQCTNLQNNGGWFIFHFLIVYDLSQKFYYVSFQMCPIACDETREKDILSKTKNKRTNPMLKKISISWGGSAVHCTYKWDHKNLLYLVFPFFSNEVLKLPMSFLLISRRFITWLLGRHFRRSDYGMNREKIRGKSENQSPLIFSCTNLMSLKQKHKNKH